MSEWKKTEKQCKYLKCVFTEIALSAGLDVCNCTVANSASPCSSPKAECCRWTSPVQDKMCFALYPTLGRSCIKPNFCKHPSFKLIKLTVLCCIVNAVLLRVVSAPVGAIVTGLSQRLFPPIREQLREVNDAGLELKVQKQCLALKLSPVYIWEIVSVKL